MGKRRRERERSMFVDGGLSNGIDHREVEGPGCAQKRMMHDNVDDDGDGTR